MADTPETTVETCPYCGAVDMTAIANGRVPAAITIARLDRAAAAALETVYAKGVELAARCAMMARAADRAAERLRMGLEVIEEFAEGLRDERSYLAEEREAVARVASEMATSVLLLHHPPEEPAHNRD